MSPAGETKTVIITGANGNLGRVVTDIFLEKGYRVLAIVHNEKGRNEFPAHELLNIHVVNLSDEEASQLLVKTILDQNKKIDAVLMLAGGFTAGKIPECGTKEIREMISLNFETAYNLVRPILPHMQENNFGRLIFIGARPAIKPADGKNMIAYGLSKSLLFRLAEYINAEFKGKNITATVIVPGTIDTKPNREAMPGADPSKWVQPKELAEIMDFILSGEAVSLRETVLKVYNNA